MAMPEELWEANSGKRRLWDYCKKQGVPSDPLNLSLLGDSSRYALVLKIKNDPSVRTIYVYTDEAAEALLANNFDEYEFLGNYLAIFSKGKRSIEASIKPPGSIGGLDILREINGSGHGIISALGLSLENEAQSNSSDIRAKSANGDLQISLRARSKAAQALFGPQFQDFSAASLVIEGIGTGVNADALLLLNQISDALFFDIDLNYGHALTIERRPLLTPGYLISGSRPRKKVTFPEFEYDNAPMALYFHARVAQGLPLLQFLSYYQVIESYFPAFSLKEGSRQLRTALKNPGFRLDSDTDVARLFGILKKGRSNGYSPEREQMTLTLNECITDEDLRNFLLQTKERRDFFSDKQKGLTNRRINFNAPNVDTRREVSDLIYEIRCRIVHSKIEEGPEEYRPLLPNSPESELVVGYLDLMQFLAQSVLIYTSRPLKPR